MHVLRSVTVLCKPDWSVSKNSLRLGDATKKCIALFVNYACFCQPTIFSHRFRVCDVVEFDKVFGKGQRVIKHKPHSLFGISIFGAENALDTGMFFLINWSAFPNWRRWLIWIEMWMNSVVCTLLKENLADEKLSRRNLNKTPFQCHISVSSNFHVFRGFLGCPDMCYTILVAKKGVYSCNLSRCDTVNQWYATR